MTRNSTERTRFGSSTANHPPIWYRRKPSAAERARRDGREPRDCGRGPSTTAADFGSHGTIGRTTPALTPGESAAHVLPIPSGCLDADCEFTIRVDENDEIAASSEDNNATSDTCIG